MIKISKTYKIKTGCGTLAMTVDMDKDGKPVYITFRKGKGGNCIPILIETITELVNDKYKMGVPLSGIAHELGHKVGNCEMPGHNFIDGKEVLIKSCKHGMAYLLDEYLNEQSSNLINKEEKHE